MPAFVTAAGEVRVTTDHAGGNGRVTDVDEDTLTILPETRDSSEARFYWNVAVESTVAQSLRIEVPDHVSPRGPAVRQDGAWQWLGREARVDESTFTYGFDAGERVMFAVAPAYQVSDFRAACDRLGVDAGRRTVSENGRDVPLVRIGSGDEGGAGTGTADAAAARHVVVTCRHHASETTASYVLEGLLAAAAEGDLPNDLALHAVPFVDVDGVERGDHGKHRAPHDHNRDYLEGNALSADAGPIYESTSALMRYVDRLVERGEVAAGLDLHCPYKWGEGHDRPFVVEAPGNLDDPMTSFVDAMADAAADGTLTYDPTPGVGVRTFDGQSGQIDAFSDFAVRRGAALATTLEIPYVGTDGDPVTPASARQFGRDLFAAVVSTVDR